MPDSLERDAERCKRHDRARRALGEDAKQKVLAADLPVTHERRLLEGELHDAPDGGGRGSRRAGGDCPGPGAWPQVPIELFGTDTEALQNLPTQPIPLVNDP